MILVMDIIVYLNVGGKKFETSLSTLKLLPYFMGLVRFYGDDTWSTPETPYFIDRDPKIFRHILNFLRNPEYKYPDKYIDELEFYGCNIKEIKEQISEIKKESILRKESLLTPDDNNKQKCKPYDTLPLDTLQRNRLTNGPHITFFKEIFRSHTPFNPPVFTNILFDTKQWSHQIVERDMLLSIDLLIPEYFLNKLKFFNITFTFFNDKFTFNLEVIQCLQRIQKYDNLLLFNISSMTIIQKLLILENKSNFSIELSCSYEGKRKVETILKLTTVILHDEERNRLTNGFIAFSGIKFFSEHLVNNEFLLPPGSISCLIFNVNDDYDYVSIEYVVDGKIVEEMSFKTSRFDATLTTKMHTPFINGECSNDFGVLCFSLENPFGVQSTGHLESDGNYRVKFYGGDTLGNGVIWVAMRMFIQANHNGNLTTITTDYN